MKTVLHLAFSRLKYNKERSLLTIIAIALMTTLLMTIGSAAFTFIRYQQIETVQNAGNYHANLKGVTAEQIFMLENHADVESVLTRERIASIEIPKLNAFLNYERLRKGSINTIELKEGTMPEEVNEIAGPPALFERLGVTVQIGQTVKIPLRVNESKIQMFDFTISGLIKQADISSLNVNETRLSYGAYVSQAFVEQYVPSNKREYNSYIRITDENRYSKDEIEAIITDIGADIGLTKTHISFNDQYLTYMTNPSADVQNIVIGFGLLITILGGMVIYSIYYVSVISNIQEIGKLKALGAAKQHIRCLMLTESMVLSIIGIPLGLLFGYFITVFMFTVIIFKGVSYGGSFLYPSVILIVALAVWITILISVSAPVKMAAAVSPTEAMRYQELQGKRKTKKSFKILSISKLAYANIQRNKRRTAVTILALGFSGILFMITANIANNVTAESYARIVMPKGDFEISLSYSINDQEYPEKNLNFVQLENLLGDSLKNQLLSIDGVESIEEKHTVLADTTYKSLEKQRLEISGINKQDLGSLKTSLKRGSLDYDKMLHSNGLIFTWDYFFEEYGFQIGDTIECVIYDGNRKIPFTGTLLASTNSSDSTFLIADELLQKLVTNANPTNAIYVTVQADKYSNAKAQINVIQQSNKNFLFKAYDEELEVSNHFIHIIRYTVYGLLAVIGVIGYISLVNTMITSILVRKKEFGMLQAIGLSDHQLLQMVHREGMFFTLGTLLLSLLVGNGLGYLFVRLIISTKVLEINQYKYPLFQTIVFIIAVCSGQAIITFFANKYIHRQSLVERMRD